MLLEPRRNGVMSRTACRPLLAAAWVAARTMASAIVSAASAPTSVTFASPVQRPVASEKTVSPSPVVWMD